jgi:hypothetical protein
MHEEVKNLISLANISLTQTDNLDSLVSEIQSLAVKMQIQFPNNSLASICQYVEVNKADLLTYTGGLDRLLATELKKAKEDRDNLKKAVNLYEQALSFYTDASLQVNRTGSMPLIKELEQHERLLNHQDIKALLLQRKWADYNNALNLIIADLQNLKDLAVRYQEEGFEYEEESQDESSEEIPPKEQMTEADALKILGLAKEATKEEIKRVYREQVKK